MVFLRIFLRILCAPSYYLYHRALKNPERAQRKALKSILKTVGLHKEVRTYQEFCEHFPIVDYEGYLQQTTHTLNDKVLFTEKTSGSSSAKKEIPYTKKLIGSFTQMMAVWSYDLLKYGPSFDSMQLYFSVSPQFHDEGNNRLDTEYITGPIASLIDIFSIVPANIKSVKDPRAFKHLVALYMIKATQLEIISVWSPSFFTGILDYIKEHSSELLRDLDKENINYSGQLFSFNKLSEQRASELRQSNLAATTVFKHLKLISCWGSASASYHLNLLKDTFPHVTIQQKGLLATEGAFSIPLMNVSSPAPLLSEVFREFEDENGKILRLHELKPGSDYELIISQKSGLIRYRMKDMIRVKELFKGSPTFEFLGRADNVSDLVGEKLNEQFVSELAMEHFSDQSLCLVPKLSDSCGYVALSNKPLNSAKLDTLLMENPHYQNARKLSQLLPVESMVHQNMQSFISDYLSSKGTNLGDLKMRSIYINEHQGDMLQFISRAITQV
jgi:hypothetical protein